MDKTRCFLMTLLIGGGIWIHAVNPAHSSYTPISIQLPAASLDLSDLDVRDHNNRRVFSPQHKYQLRTLFEFNLNGMILQNLTPTKRAVVNVLEKSWNGAFGWLRAAVHSLSILVTGWFNKSKWMSAKARLVHSSVTPATERWRADSSAINFHSLIPSLISSTTLLR
jgi:hypothetical protein